MPIVNHYVVEQTREVKITANSLESALLLAQQTFRGTESTEVDEKPVTVWGHPTGPIKETDVHVRESY